MGVDDAVLGVIVMVGGWEAGTWQEAGVWEEGCWGGRWVFGGAG